MTIEGLLLALILLAVGTTLTIAGLEKIAPREDPGRLSESHPIRLRGIDGGRR